MSVTLDVQPALVNHTQLEIAVLETLAYSDIFDHPLTLDELHRFLTAPAQIESVRACIVDMKTIAFRHGYYFLAGREEIVNIRKRREKISRKAFDRALFYGRILGRLPFIRMVALTGSLAMLNLSKNKDMDFMLVTKPGRLWTGRVFALLLGRLARLFGDVICPNVIVSENSLGWAVRNLYTAREFAQMIPVSGADVFCQLCSVNLWVNDFLPNHVILRRPQSFNAGIAGRSIFEYFLNGRPGDSLESWEMNRKIIRFTKQKGYGVETNFTADVCQGNFDHHGAYTMQKYEQRLEALKVKP